MNILITEALKLTKLQINELEKLGHKVFYIENELSILDLDVSIFDAVICNSLFIHNDIRKFLNLKYIQITSSGYDRVPIDYINEKGIIIHNARGVYSIPMAEWTILKILEIYKNNKIFHLNQMEHKWLKQRNLFELNGKTILILGFGSVGEEIAIRLKSFGTKIIASDIRKIDSYLVDNYFHINLLYDNIIKADIVIITLPLTEETYHLFDFKLIKSMKNKSVLVNLSRGSVINEKDLIKAIKMDKFLGVALDVFEEEPLKEISQLWSFDNVYITPHNSFVSEKNNDRLFNLIYKNLLNRK